MTHLQLGRQRRRLCRRHPTEFLRTLSLGSLLQSYALRFKFRLEKRVETQPRLLDRHGPCTVRKSFTNVLMSFPILNLIYYIKNYLWKLYHCKVCSKLKKRTYILERDLNYRPEPFFSYSLGFSL